MKNEESDNDIEVQIRGTKTLDDFYGRCNLAILELSSFETTIKEDGWKAVMEEEIKMILINQTSIMLHGLKYEYPTWVCIQRSDTSII